MHPPIIGRPLAGLTGLALITASLAACSDGASSGAVEITALTYHNAEVMGAVVEAFEAANDGITVKLSDGGTEYAQTLQTRISGNQTPDIFNLTTDNRTDIMGAGVALDITGEDFLEGIDAANFTLYSQDGKVYGMPVTAWIGGAVYNKDLLKEAGYSTLPETWDGYLEMGAKLAETGTSTFLYQGGPDGVLVGLLASRYAGEGIPEMDDIIYDGTSSFETEWVPVLEQWRRQVENETMPAESIGMGGDQVKQAFLTGEVAVYRTGPWDRNDLDASGIDWGFAAFPSYPGSDYRYLNGGPDQGYAISASASTEKQEAAKKFLAFLNSEEGLEILTEKTGTLSLSSHFVAEPPAAFKDAFDNEFAQNQFYWLNWAKGATAMQSLAQGLEQEFLKGDITAQEMAQQLDEKWASVK